MKPNTHPIRDALLATTSDGSFAATFETSAMGLVLEVEGKGPYRLPVTPEQLDRLVGQAVPSPFGYRDQTRMDETVRKALEIDGSKVHLDPSTWNARLERGLNALTKALGFPSNADVAFKLQKLVFYEEGGFFAPHRDTERDRTMRGSMVVVLPSTYTGGAMVVSHANQQVVFDTSAESAARRLSFLGFYADCVHEIRPVKQGCRVALIFSLHAEMPAPPPVLDGGLAGLTAAVGRFFVDEERLVVLLDHSYTDQQFGWGDLKNQDRARASLLRAAAERNDCACYLAFANVQETFAYGDDDEDSVPTVEDFGALLERQLTLKGWRDEGGDRCRGDSDEAYDDSIVSLLPARGRHPYEVSGEGWTGNEGGTAAQWYHQAAIVLLPRGSSLQKQTKQPVEAKPKARQVVRRRKRD